MSGRSALTATRVTQGIGCPHEAESPLAACDLAQITSFNDVICACFRAWRKPKGGFCLVMLGERAMVALAGPVHDT